MEACSLVAGFEYALFFIPEMCGQKIDPRLGPNFIQVPQRFGVTHQGQEGELMLGESVGLLLDGPSYLKWPSTRPLRDGWKSFQTDLICLDLK